MEGTRRRGKKKKKKKKKKKLTSFVSSPLGFLIGQVVVGIMFLYFLALVRGKF